MENANELGGYSVIQSTIIYVPGRNPDDPKLHLIYEVGFFDADPERSGVLFGTAVPDPNVDDPWSDLEKLGTDVQSTKTFVLAVSSENVHQFAKLIQPLLQVDGKNVQYRGSFGDPNLGAEFVVEPKATDNLVIP